MTTGVRCRLRPPTLSASSAHPPSVLRALRPPCVLRASSERPPRILCASSMRLPSILPACSLHPSCAIPCILLAPSAPLRAPSLDPPCILRAPSLHPSLHPSPPGQPAERQAVGSEAEDEVPASSLLTDRLTTAFNRPQAADFTRSLESAHNNIFRAHWSFSLAGRLSPHFRFPFLGSIYHRQK